MPDPRFFAKLDVGYFDNPKVGVFLDEQPRVPILHLRAIVYCRQHLTDGLFPIKQVVRLACGSHCGSECDAQCDFCAAVHAGLFVRVSERTALVHDYLKHQDSAEQVTQRKTAGQKGAATRWSVKDDADRNAVPNADRNAVPNAEERRGEERRTNVRSITIEHDFEAWYARYPRKEGRGRALKAYKAALKKESADTLLKAIEQQADRLMEKGRNFCPHPATWLNAERWADEVEPSTVTRRNMPEAW